MDEVLRHYEARIDHLISVLRKIASEFYGPISTAHAARLAIEEDEKLAKLHRGGSGDD